MDANGQNFWILADEKHWDLSNNSQGLEYDPIRRSLRLASRKANETVNAPGRTPDSFLNKTPHTFDVYGNRAYWNNSKGTVDDTEAAEKEDSIYKPPQEFGSPTDLVMGHDGVLYIAFPNRLLLHDRRERWEDTVIIRDGFNPWRLAANPSGGVWILNKEQTTLGKLAGKPLPRLTPPYSPDFFRPVEENPDPPRIEIMEKVVWPDTETPVALASSPEGKLAFLCDGKESFSKLRLLTRDEGLSEPIILNNIHQPYSLGWVSEKLVAILIPGLKNEALVYRTENIPTEQVRQSPVGDLYPLKKGFQDEPFIHGLKFPLYYPVEDGCHPLHRLSFPFYSNKGVTFNNSLYAPFDSQDENTVWHRLFVEAVIPPGCGIKVWVSTSKDSTKEISDLDQHWHEHQFGNIHQKGHATDTPVGTWEPNASELPHHKGMLPCERKKDESGLFSVLIQRAGLKVRSLVGRSLKIRVELEGTGHTTPEIFSIRAYGSRFSYINQYLPQLYKETVFQPEADQRDSATGSDFLERYVNNIEGVLTSMEDRVGNAHLLTHPQTVPTDSIEWLASWTGFDSEPNLPEQRRRNFLEAAPDLHRWHGTLRGLKMALELATGGITGGEIVVLEDFKLRRTFATILGADLDDEEDPLTAGAAISGNSYVGDTLFLGDENRKEFLAVFNFDPRQNDSEQAAIDALFDNLAYRVTVLVHEEVEPQDLGLIRQIAAREVPAHVELKVISSTHPFITGMSALVGVDSYLVNRLPQQPATVGHSRIGWRDYVQGPMALNSSLRPIARGKGATTTFGNKLTLDASDSRAFEGRRIIEYHWKYIGRSNSL